VVVIGTDWLIGVTSPHATPGTFDVVLLHGNQRVVVPGAFTYAGPPAPVPPLPPTTPTTQPAPPVTEPRPPVTTPTPPVTTPAPPVTQPQPPVTDPAPTLPATVPATDPSAGSATSAPPAVAVPGLTLAPLPSSSPLADLPAGLWDGMTCRAASCDG
jgi:hypothetical protein